MKTDVKSFPINQVVFQFHISLVGISPPIWRRILTPSIYTFWDLHVAVQDSMGWLDCHLHEFTVERGPKKRKIKIGMPEGDPKILAGWEVPITNYFNYPGFKIPYEYDFGDGWNHEILLEGVLLGENGVKYPVCTGGERACPPEDCRGTWGYEDLLNILKDPNHNEYKDTIDWLKGHAKNYFPYDPEEFDPVKVQFSDPHERWMRAFPAKEIS